MDPLRILMINTEHGWRGGENQVQLLVAGLSPGFLPITACQPDAPLARRLAAAGHQVVPLRMRGGFDLGAARALRRVVREQHIAVVHAHTSHAHALGLLACWGGEVPLVVTRRVDFAIGRGPFARWKYGRRVRRFVAISQEVRRVLLAGGVPPAAVAVIPSGIDLARFATAPPAALRATLGAGADEVLVGITAALSEHKDHRTLLAAWALVEARMPRARLLVVGAGELDAALRAQAAQLGLRRAQFMGFREDVPEVLGCLDVFVLSSQQEGLGTSIMDAMCVGLPVVATSAGGIPELIRPDEDGLLVPPRDPPALAEALCRVIGDAGLRARLGAAARRSAAARFSCAAMVAGYEGLYRELAAAPAD